MTTAKRTALFGLLSVTAGGIVLGVGFSQGLDESSGIVVSIVDALLFGIGFLVAVRVRCSACGRRLSQMFPAGSLLLLWAAKQRCRGCNQWV